MKSDHTLYRAWMGKWLLYGTTAYCSAGEQDQLREEERWCMISHEKVVLPVGCQSLQVLLMTRFCAMMLAADESN